MDKTGPRGLLDAVARGVGQVIHKKLIDAEQLLPAVGYDAEVLVQRTVLIAAVQGVGLVVIVVFANNGNVGQHGLAFSSTFFSAFFSHGAAAPHNFVGGHHHSKFSSSNPVSGSSSQKP